MVIVGTNAGITAMRGRFPAEGDAALSFLTTPLFSMVAFAALVAAAIRLRRDPQTHKRLMLLATISILDAAVARLPFEFLRSSTWNYIPTTDVFLGAAILYDLVSRRTVHRAYIWGGLLLVIEQALRIPVGETERVEDDRPARPASAEGERITGLVRNSESCNPSLFRSPGTPKRAP